MAMIRMIAGPIRAQDSEDGEQIKPSVTRVMRDRIAAFLDGDWDQLWEEANAPVKQREHTQSEEAHKRSKIKRAEHKAMVGQLSDAHSTLLNAGLLDPHIPDTMDQLLDIHRVEDEAVQLPPSPDEEALQDKRYDCKIDTIKIKGMGGMDASLD